MTTGLFAINPEAQVRVETLSSGCPVLVVDDVYLDPFAVRERALGDRYESSLAYYPGVHARIDKAEIKDTCQQLAQLLSLIGAHSVMPEAFVTDFSLVTTPASEMLAKQKHPHVDGMVLAGVVYLNPDYEIGTSFFRHRPTGLAFLLNNEDRECYQAWLDEEGEHRQPKSYAVDDDDIWEHLHSVRGRFNRLVMYPGSAFHSIAMHDVAATLTMESARLTQRFFIADAEPRFSPV